MAPPSSFAATRAPQVLREADRTAAELERLLGVTPVKGAPPLEILLVDATPGGPGEGPIAAPVPDGAPAPAGGYAPLLRVISPEGAAEPLARPMTRALAGRWLGGRAASATTVLDGLAGL